MAYTVKQLEIVTKILRDAQDEILERVGMNCRVVLCRTDLNNKTPQELLNVIAATLDVNPEQFAYNTRRVDIVELRRIGAFFLKRVFPLITLQEIGKLFGGQDHTTISSALKQAQNMIDTKDPAFFDKYNAVVVAVDEWVRLNRQMM